MGNAGRKAEREGEGLSIMVWGGAVTPLRSQDKAKQTAGTTQSPLYSNTSINPLNG